MHFIHVLAFQIRWGLHTPEIIKAANLKNRSPVAMASRAKGKE